MSPLQFAHVIFLGLWGGCVFVEVLLELSALKNNALHNIMPELHYKIDVFIELPLLFLVLATGIFLFQSAAMSPLLVLKAGAGLWAVAANVYCVFVVIKRKKAADRGDGKQVEKYTRRVFASAITGIPAGLCALFLGLYFMGFIK